MTTFEEFELLASSSQRLQQLETQFEQVCQAAMMAIRTSDDLVLLVLGLSAELKALKSSSDVAGKAIDYVMRNNLLPKKVEPEAPKGESHGI